MKKLLVLFTVILWIGHDASAQKNKIQTAWNYLKYDELDKAKIAIDEAAAHESTIGMAKTWYYRGLIYQKIYKNEKFGNLDPDPLVKAAESYQKALKIEPEYEFKNEINSYLVKIANDMFAEGVDHFNAKTFDKALISFENVLRMSPNDTSATLNAAYSAERSGDKVKAKAYYNQLLSMNYNDPKIYIFLGNIQKSELDTAGALATIKKGRQAFPADNSLIIEELNIYLLAGRDEEALKALNLAVQADALNPTLHFAQGTLFDKLNRKEEAAVSYKKAIELKPDYFDAVYNLGAMYFNEAAEMANKANDLKSNTEYDKAKKSFDARFKEAQPYLEKAHELKPDDNNTMVSLKQLYARLNETEKYEKINAKLNKK